LTIGKVQRFLIKCFGKPRKLKKRPLLKESHYKQRKNFAKYIIENDIDHKKIYFTDEKRFLLNFAPNPQNNQIRLTKESKELLKKNNDKINKLMTIELEKHPKGIMVAGGVSSYGVGKLNFCIGTMNSFAYKQTLQNYEKDINYFHQFGVNLIFQQDNAPCHTNKESKKYLDNLNKLKFWPANSPDLSPIETVWSFVSKHLEGYKFNTLEELEKKIVFIWNRIPTDYCERLFNKFINDIEQLYKNGKIQTKKNHYKTVNLKKEGTYENKIENIVYNEKTLKKFLKNKKSYLKKKIETFTNIINQMNNKDMIKSAKDFINSKYFDTCYKEMSDYQEKKLLEIKEEYEKIRNQTEKTYFDSLSQEKKEKIIGYGNGDTNDEETKTNSTIVCIQEEDSQRAEEIIDKIIQKQKIQIKRKIKSYLLKNIVLKKRAKKNIWKLISDNF